MKKIKKRKMEKITIDLDNRSWSIIDKIAYESGNSRQSVIRHLLWEEMNRQKNEKQVISKTSKKY